MSPRRNRRRPTGRLEMGLPANLPPPTSRGRLLERAQRLLRRPLVSALFVAALASLVFPRLQPRELTLTERLPPRGCVKALEVAAFDGENLVRASRHLIVDQLEVRHVFLLPKGEYRLRLDLGCARGATRAIERTLTLEESRSVDFDLSNDCPC